MICMSGWATVVLLKTVQMYSPVGFLSAVYKGRQTELLANNSLITLGICRKHIFVFSFFNKLR